MKRTIVVGVTLLLVACTSADGPDRNGPPQVRSEAECLVAVDSAKCRIENALAGGPPINLAQE